MFGAKGLRACSATPRTITTSPVSHSEQKKGGFHMRLRLPGELAATYIVTGFLLLTGADPVATAASIVSVADPTGDVVFQANGHATPPQFYAPVVDLVEASVSLNGQTNTFEITAVGAVLAPASFAGS